MFTKQNIPWNSDETNPQYFSKIIYMKRKEANPSITQEFGSRIAGHKLWAWKIQRKHQQYHETEVMNIVKIGSYEYREDRKYEYREDRKYEYREDRKYEYRENRKL
nr:hypothetical protein Iba_chr13eCG13080 [Ipomoea batatas]